MNGDAADTARTYDRIAEHFAATREYAWPEVETFLDGREGQVRVTGGPAVVRLWSGGGSVV